MNPNLPAGSVPFQLSHHLPRTARAYERHRLAARTLERVVGRFKLGFPSGLDYLVAVSFPSARAVLEAGYAGLPLPEGWEEGGPEIDGMMWQLVEGLDRWLRQPSRKPREERVVDMFRRFGQDPFPRVAPSPAPAPPRRERPRGPVGPRGLPHEFRDPRRPSLALALGLRRRRMAGA